MELKIVEQYKEGFQTFEKLFNMSDDEIKSILKEILADDYSRVLDNNPTITKTIVNSVPREISVSFYDSITINAFGITYKAEHAYENKKLIEFNRFFKL